MADSITISGNTREEQYASLLPQIEELAQDEAGQLAVLGNIMSALKYGMDFYWVGLYGVQGDSLVLGPFQGTVACTTIGFGKGVCGNAWKNKKTIIVDDVNTFKGHIACSTESKSEIVLPIFDEDGEVIMVLDVDSDKLAHFSATDEHWLKKVTTILEKVITA